MSTQHEPVIPAGHEEVYASWHLAPAVRAGDTVYCSGVIGLRPDATVPTDLAEEIDLAFTSLAVVLEAAGSSLAQVVDLVTFHLDLLSQVPVYMQVRDRHLTEPWPAWTALGVSQVAGALPGARIEIRATAFSPRTS